MHQMYEFTSIGRPLDPKYRTNLLILSLIPLFAAVAGVLALVAGAEARDVLLAAINTGATVAIAWILGREISPDFPYASHLAALLGGIASLVLGAPVIGIAAGFALVLFARVVNRIVGPPLKPFDTVVVVILIVLLAAAGQLFLAIAGVIALLLDAWLPPAHRIHFAAAGIAAFGVIAGTIAAGFDAAAPLTLPYFILLALGTGLFTLTIFATVDIECETDLSGYDVSLLRIRTTMMLVLAATVTYSLWQGDSGMVALMPVWAALIGISLYRLPASIAVLMTTGQRSQSSHE